MTAVLDQLQLGNAPVMRGRGLKRGKQHRHDAAHAILRAVRAQGGKSHFAVESNQFTHGSHRETGWGAGGTMKRLTSQGIAA